MSKIEDGGPAFPTFAIQFHQGPHGTSYTSAVKDKDGMSLRDWFAGQAACALGSALNTIEGSRLLIKASSEHDALPAELIAVTAYQIADAMLAERSRHRKGEGK